MNQQTEAISIELGYQTGFPAKAVKINHPFLFS
ncbi:hypothetical protein TRIP_C60446 [Candidatus Zixiibacteriota bacterium]|nr:hypothetical protein TRIP_C60446 [candidate division Zixibacteria bacterium]